MTVLSITLVLCIDSKILLVLLYLIVDSLVQTEYLLDAAIKQYLMSKLLPLRSLNKQFNRSPPSVEWLKSANNKLVGTLELGRQLVWDVTSVDTVVPTVKSSNADLSR